MLKVIDELGEIHNETRTQGANKWPIRGDNIVSDITKGKDITSSIKPIYLTNITTYA